MKSGEYPPLCVKVWGPYACFTRPEVKVERVTYPVMTPFCRAWRAGSHLLETRV